MFHELKSDLRHALRLLAHSPGFTVAATLTLALGIGVNAALFSVVYGVILRPLPIPEAERLVVLRDTQPPEEETPVSYAEFLDWEERSRSFDGLAAWAETRASFTTGGEPARVPAMRASGALLTILGARPILGRGFRPEEDRRDAERVLMISHGLWQRQFGGGADVVGRVIPMDGYPWTVIGVLPSDFDTRGALGGDFDIWFPLRLDGESAPRDLHFLRVMGRLAPGVNLAAARAEMNDLAERLKKERAIDHGVTMLPLRASVAGEVRPALVGLLGAVGFVLLIACANVANLLLARSVGRRKEIALRLALGATRWRVVRQLLTESTLIGLLGGLAGSLLAAWSVGILSRQPLAGLPRAHEIDFDARMLAFTLGLSLLSVLVFGLTPALQSVRAGLSESLKESGLQLSPARLRLRTLLVGGQVALSLILLTGAGLLTVSLARALAAPRGFDESDVLTMEVGFPFARFPDGPAQARAWDELLTRVAAVPGVESAAAIANLPLSGGWTAGSFNIEGRTWPEGEEPTANFQLVSADYFRTLRVRLLRGRFFTAADGASAPAVAIVSRDFAELHFPGENPVGRRIDFRWNTTGFQEIVGVVDDVRYLALDATPVPAIYVPAVQNPVSALHLGLALMVRTRATPEALLPALRAEVRAVDPDAPISAVQPLTDIVSASVGNRRLSTGLLGLFSLLALALAAVGIHGVVAALVAQRTRELGIRMALGAAPRDLLRLVMSSGMKMIGGGLIVGLLGTLGLTRLLAAFLVDISPTDPLTLAGVATILTAVALLACWLPARRATQLDPIQSLRAE